MKKIRTIVLLSGLAGNLAYAAQWYAEPAVLYTAEFSDNRRLVVTSPQDTFGSIYTGALRLGTDTSITRFYVEPSVVIRRYDEEEDLLDSDDTYLQLFLERKGKVSGFTLAANYRDESTIISEFADAGDGNPDLDDPIVDDTGDARISVNRKRLNIRPKWKYDFGERSGIRLKGRFTTVEFDQIAQLTKSDYDSFGIGVEYLVRASEKLRWGPQITASRFEADQTNNETDNVTALLGLSYKVSPLTTFVIEAGAIYSEASFTEMGAAVTEDSTDGVYKIGFEGTSQVTGWNVFLSRRVNPSGSGFQKTRDQLLASVSRDLSDRTRLIFRTRYYQEESNDVGVTNRDRNYGRAEIQFDWQATRNIAVQFAYQYTRQKQDILPNAADSNVFFATVGYRPSRLAMSR